MTYEDMNLPDFMKEPQKAAKAVFADDGFDPSPYERILNTSMTGQTLFGMHPLEQELAEIAADEAIGLTPADMLNTVPVEKPVYEPPRGSHMEVSKELRMNSVSYEIAEVPAPTQDPVAPTSSKAETVATQTPDEAEAVEASIAVSTPVQATPKREATCIIPLAGTVIYDQLKLNDVKEKQGTRIFIEEDILVPDIKPDLATILLMTGTARLDNKEFKAGANGEDFLKITGEVALQTLYIPEVGARQEPLITIQSVVPFKADWTVNVSPLSQLVIKPVVESVDFTVINERKFRAKLTVYLTMKEYEDIEIQLFEGIKGEELQTLKEQIRLTGIVARKTETLDFNEELPLKEGALKPERILKYDINVAESHKQVGRDKAIVNAVIYCNTLYLGRNDEDQLVPQLYQGKTEFAQFMPLDNVDDLAGSKASFNSAALAIRIKNNDEDGTTKLELQGTVDTTLEIYKTLEKEIVSDVYHSQKDIAYDYSELSGVNLCGSGVTEISAREIFNVPSKYPDVEKIVYIAGRLKKSNSILEQGKNIVEGVMEITLLCTGEDEAHTMFKIVQELPFRGAMDIPGVRSGMKAADDISLKEMWFDKINGRQVEVNAGIMVSSAVFSQDTYHLIKNVCFLDQPQEEGRKACMIIYNAREGDNLWKIAKKYRTTIGCLQKINNLEQNTQVAPGTRLLIVY